MGVDGMGAGGMVPGGMRPYGMGPDGMGARWARIGCTGTESDGMGLDLI